MKAPFSPADRRFMRLALRLARRAYGRTSPNPLVGAVIVRAGKILGRGWHRQAGQPHAEIEAVRDALLHGHRLRGATLYATLEPCSTHGRTPPCTDALRDAGLRRVVVAATDPNPDHAGRGFALLRKAGLAVVSGLEARKAGQMNEAFNHWIVRRTPFVTVKAAMTLDGKIATASGQSQWITGSESRAHAHHLRLGADAILVGVNTVIADDPSLTARAADGGTIKGLRRLVLDPRARTPLRAKVITDAYAGLTTVVVTAKAPKSKVTALAKRVRVWTAPTRRGQIHLGWLLRKLGSEQVTHLLVEGGGETNATFLEQRQAHRVAFFYAPKVLGGRDARPAVGGAGARSWAEVLPLEDLEWRRFGPDLFLTATVGKMKRE